MDSRWQVRITIIGLRRPMETPTLWKLRLLNNDVLYRVSLISVLGAVPLHPLSRCPLSDLVPILTWTGILVLLVVCVTLFIWLLKVPTPLGPICMFVYLVLTVVNMHPGRKRTLVTIGTLVPPVTTGSVLVLLRSGIVIWIIR